MWWHNERLASMEWNREGVFGSGAGKKTDREGELEQGLEHLIQTFAFQHH